MVFPANLSETLTQQARRELRVIANHELYVGFLPNTTVSRSSFSWSFMGGTASNSS